MGSSPPRQVAFAIRGPLTRADLPGLTERLSRELAGCGRGTVLCDVREVPSDGVAVDALARLQLAARRHGCCVRLQGASGELRDLVSFMGLQNVLPE
jgi:ABC-type transporter Mla MlaB component